MHSSLAGIVNTFQLLKKSEQEFVLATIVETSGSTYRKPGARMLITRADRFYGLLGGGCFEADLLEHARKVFVSKQSNTVYYDMRAPEDLIWGLGLGCNGAVKIRLEHLSPENNFAPLSLIATMLANDHRAGSLITVCDSRHPAVPPDQHYWLTDSTAKEAIPQAIRDKATQILASAQSSLVTVLIEDQPVEIFVSSIIPPVRLAIIGAGPDAVPVTRAAKLLDWEVTVIDYRESCTRPENFPEANRIINAAPEQLTEKINLQSIDAVVLMTHKFEYDLRYLQALLIPSIRYIGLLGPVARKRELLKHIDPDKLEDIKNRIYGPVGMNIGGELPEEIALSLVAEVQAVMYERDGRHLSVVAAEAIRENPAGGLAIAILAAGGSTRFGALKQLLEYNGRSFLKRIVEIAVELPAKQVLVVHGPKATKCQREISGFEVTNLVNNEWETGLSSSLKIAVNNISAECDAIMVLLCDQPLINAEHLLQLISTWRTDPGKIVASEYANCNGVPAIIPRSCFSQLNSLVGDTGARHIISSFSDIVVSIPVPDAEFDIDTQDDFADLLARQDESTR